MSLPKAKSKTPVEPIEHVVVEFDSDNDVALVNVMRQKFGKGKAPQTCVGESSKRDRPPNLSSSEIVY